MDNCSALKQLPFLGKQTVPSKLRKDFWTPMATVTFPTGHQGLEAYRQLREFRVRHEHEWTLEEVGARTKIDGRMGVKAAARRVRDQKANSIADLAFVLTKQAKLAEQDELAARKTQTAIQSAMTEAKASLPRIKSEMRAAKAETRSGNPEAWDRYKELKRQKLRIPRALGKPRPDSFLAKRYDSENDTSTMPKRGFRKRRMLAARIPDFSMQGLRVAWADLKDAEFASSWPQGVVHDALDFSKQRSRHVAPPVSVIENSPIVGKVIEETPDQEPVQPAASAPRTQNNLEKGAILPPEPGVLDRLLVRLRDGAR